MTVPPVPEPQPPVTPAPKRGFWDIMWDAESRPRRLSRWFWRVLRYGLVVVVVLTAAAWLGDESFAVCKTVVRTGHEAAKTVTCAPPGLNTPLVVGVLLLVVLLMLPDMSEVAVLGITLKKQVRVAAENAKKAEEATHALSNHVSQLVMASNLATSSASASNNLSLFTERDAETVQFAVGSDGGAGTQQRSTLELVGAIVTNWAELNELLNLDARLRVRADFGTPRDEYVSGIRFAFVEEWHDELLALRRLRNSVAHGGEISRERLEEGDTLLVKLRDDYLTRIAHISRAADVGQDQSGD